MPPEPQSTIISRVRDLCRTDDRVVAALMYGSFTKGEADAYSDVEFVIFVEDDALADFDTLAWLNRVAPVALYFINEYGVGTAIFESLVRGEFHFDPASSMPEVRAWEEESGFPPPDKMLVLDRTGELRAHLEAIAGPGPDRTDPGTVTWNWHAYLNWMLFGAGVLARGERARALELLWFIQRYLIRFARLIEGTTEHWQTPSKALERDLSSATYDRYVATTAGLRGHELEHAYQAAWNWGVEMAYKLREKYDVDIKEDLIDGLSGRLTCWLKAEDQLRHVHKAYTQKSTEDGRPDQGASA